MPCPKLVSGTLNKNTEVPAAEVANDEPVFIAAQMITGIKMSLPPHAMDSGSLGRRDEAVCLQYACTARDKPDGKA